MTWRYPPPRRPRCPDSAREAWRWEHRAQSRIRLACLRKLRALREQWDAEAADLIEFDYPKGTPS